ncbi:MAG: 3-phosphoshikimate 1-carboxyvinyltransferase [Prochlorococcus marinus CUG1439]|nr:3-phosphoshikimate 1-carboxyvinyltransferase [Prochlorococcus sp. MIT 1314]MCR8538962.1 3-phosphoshikimate 1-carboxyvinyltransferase [Prochlorococcus marinus CUG1439]
MSSIERQELIKKRKKEREIKLGIPISNKKYDSKEFYELVKITNFL